MENYDHLLQGHYGHVNQVIEHEKAKLVETHLAEWDSDGGWECAEWTLIIDGKETIIARCDGYSGVEFLDNISEHGEDLEEWIEETVKPYTLSDLQLEARDNMMEDAEEDDKDVRILATHDYVCSDINADSKNRPTLINDDDGTERTWPTYADAQAWIDEQEEKTYYLDHGEMGRPSYRIVK